MRYALLALLLLATSASAQERLPQESMGGRQPLHFRWSMYGQVPHLGDVVQCMYTFPGNGVIDYSNWQRQHYGVDPTRPITILGVRGQSFNSALGAGEYYDLRVYGCTMAGSPSPTGNPYTECTDLTGVVLSEVSTGNHSWSQYTNVNRTKYTRINRTFPPGIQSIVACATPEDITDAATFGNLNFSIDIDLLN
jgi:hypothetical protein